MLFDYIGDIAVGVLFERSAECHGSANRDEHFGICTCFGNRF